MTYIVALGGTTRPNSSIEKAMAITCRAAQAHGASVRIFDGSYISSLPHYGVSAKGNAMGAEMVDAIRQADGVIIASPGYHGSISGMMKNALDHLEELSRDERPYLDGRPVGLIAASFGHQAAMSTLLTLRTITHALRGWPTPMGAAIRTTADTFDADGETTDESAKFQLEMVGQQVAKAAGRL